MCNAVRSCLQAVGCSSANADRAIRIARFIREALDVRRFTSTDAFLIAIDARFPGARFDEFVGGYFMATLERERTQ